MLPLENVDLADLALALEDHSSDHSWWLDTRTGSVAPRFVPSDEQAQHLLRVVPLPSSVGYRDMEDFVAQVRDQTSRQALERSIVGRGAFRRFKDALIDLPDLRRAWFAFHDARGERRALKWLSEQELVEGEAVAAALARVSELGPDAMPGVVDGEAVARLVAEDLRRHYGDRLHGVVLVGPWARGEGRPDVDLRLVVTLDAVADRWAEKRAMDHVLWRHTVRSDTVITAIPVAATESDSPAPLLASAVTDGLQIR